MSDKRDPDSEDETEFGLGPGLIDPIARTEYRDTLQPHQLMSEIYSLPKTFDGSMPDRKPPAETPVPRLAPGETEADRA